VEDYSGGTIGDLGSERTAITFGSKKECVEKGDPFRHMNLRSFPYFSTWTENMPWKRGRSKKCKKKERKEESAVGLGIIVWSGLQTRGDGRG